MNLRKKYELDISQVMYDYASKLLSLVEDDEILDLYKDNPIFAKISSMSNEEILRDKDLLRKAIKCLEEFLNNKPDKEEIEELAAILNNLDENALNMLIKIMLDNKP